MTKHFIALLLFFSALSFDTFGQAPNVIAVSPSANSLSNPASGQIIIDFDVPVSVLSMTSDNVHVWGRWSGPMSGSFSSENGQTRFRFTPSEPFMAGEYVTVTLDTEVRTPATNIPMAQGYTFSFWVETLPSPMTLYPIDTINVRRANEGWIQSYGAYAGDLDDDGYSDLTVVNEVANDIRMFTNDQNDEFTYLDNPSSTWLSKPSPNEGADFDKDGYIDLAVASSTGDHVTVFRGDGSGLLQYDSAYLAADRGRGLCLLDANGDGWDDIVTANYVGNNVTLLVNNGDGTFGAPIVFDAGDEEWSICVADVNEDGLPDLVVGARASRDLHILLGDGASGFTAADTFQLPSNPWMIVPGDLNNDGHVDFATLGTDSGYAITVLGDGTGQLGSMTTYPCGTFPVAVDLGDLNGDGDLDLITSNYTSNDFMVFENDGTGTMINPVSYPALQAGSCTIFHDRDNDGDLDVTGIDELEDVILLFDDDSIWTNVSIAENDPIFTEALLFPVPSAGPVTLSLELKSSTTIRISLLNALGQELETVVQTTFTDGTHLVPLPTALYAHGNYYVKIDHPEGHLTLPLVILP